MSLERLNDKLLEIKLKKRQMLLNGDNTEKIDEEIKELEDKIKNYSKKNLEC